MPPRKHIRKLSGFHNLKVFGLNTFQSLASAWYRGSNVVWVFLRNVSTSALLMFVNKTETFKVIVKRSLLVSLLRCCVHLVPMAVTGFVAWLNLAGYLLGDQMPGGAANRDRDFLLLQVAAKITVCGHPKSSVVCKYLAHCIYPVGVVRGRIFGLDDYERCPSSSLVTARYPSWIDQLSFPI